MAAFANIWPRTRCIFDAVIEEGTIVYLQTTVVNAYSTASRHQFTGLIVSNSNRIEKDTAAVTKNGSALSVNNVSTLKGKGIKPKFFERGNIEKTYIAACAGLYHQSRGIAAGNQNTRVNGER